MNDVGGASQRYIGSRLSCGQQNEGVVVVASWVRVWAGRVIGSSEQMANTAQVVYCEREKLDVL